MYGLTEAIVGTFDLTKNIGTNSNTEAVRTVTNVKIINRAGLPSKKRCITPLFKGSLNFSKAGASADSSLANDPCFAVLTRL